VRRTLILTMCVLVAALAVCAGAMVALNGTVDKAQRLRSIAVLSREEGDEAAARTALVQLARLWREREGLLEVLADHDALHDVGSAIAEARICLECDDHDDFLRTMSQVDMGLEHLKDEEAVRWENLY